jgi:hypothetical protein
MLDLHNSAMLVVAVGALLSTLYAVFHSPSREPPSVPSKVPFVGYLIGLIQHGQDNLECYGESPILLFVLYELTEHIRQRKAPQSLNLRSQHLRQTLCGPLTCHHAGCSEAPHDYHIETVAEVNAERVCRTPGDT